MARDDTIQAHTLNYSWHSTWWVLSVMYSEGEQEALVPGQRDPSGLGQEEQTWVVRMRGIAVYWAVR